MILYKTKDTHDFVSPYPHLPNFMLKMESKASSTFFVITATLLIHPTLSSQQPSLWGYQEYITPFTNWILFSTFTDPWDTRPGRREWKPTLVFLPGESPSTEESDRLQSMGLQRVRHNWATNTHTHPVERYWGGRGGGWLKDTGWHSPSGKVLGGALLKDIEVSQL